MSLIEYQKEKFALLHSKYTKLINILDIDNDDMVSINLLKQINASIDALIVDLDDLKYNLQSKSDRENIYLKSKADCFSERQEILKEIYPSILLLLNKV